MKTDLLFGMNIHRSGDVFKAYPASDIQMNIASCSELGIDIVRYNNSCYKGIESIEEVRRVSELCHSKGMKLMLVVDTRSYSSLESLDEIEVKMAELYRFISSSLRDAVDIYQLYNEMDVHCMGGNIANIFLTRADGKEKGEYDYVRWERSIAAVKGAIRGMKAGYPEGKTCINFAWWHTALIYELYEQGCRWDITGLDWYEDCEAVSSIASLMDDVSLHIPETEFMICETNFWMNLHSRYTEEQKEALKNTEIRDANQAKWVPEFVDKLIELNNPKLKAVIFYELLDEPIFEQNAGSYNGEAHFGFIKCDIDGGDQARKPVFYSLKDKIKEIKNKV